LTFEEYPPARGAQKFGEQIETGGFARTVWPDQSMDGPTLDAQAYAVNGDKAGKLLCEILGLEDHLLTHSQ
jgi:hypothetical protein